MEERTESLNLKAYQMRFEDYYLRAKGVPKDCKSIDILQNKLSNLSFEAGNCYNEFKNSFPEDYQQRVRLFLQFDEYLKQLKREFKLTSGIKTSSCQFYPKHSDSSDKKYKPFNDTLKF